jgi:hypothetical protein
MDNGSQQEDAAHARRAGDSEQLLQPLLQLKASRLFKCIQLGVEGLGRLLACGHGGLA